MQHRTRTEPRVERGANARLPLQHGIFTAIGYASRRDTGEHLALTLGEIDRHDVLAYIHRECLAGDVFGSQLCRCAARLEESLETIASHGHGVIIYLRTTPAAHGQGRQAHSSPLECPYESGRSRPHDLSIADEILHELGIQTATLRVANPNACQPARNGDQRP